MDPWSNPLQDPLFTLKRYPAGGLPGQSRPLAGLLLRVQPLPVLRLLPRGPARHPPLPAAAPAHPPARAPRRRGRGALAGGGTSGPEERGRLVRSRRWSARKTFQRKSHFCLRVSSLRLRSVSFFLSFLFLGTKTESIVCELLSWKSCG